ncbi:MAG: hypothetical protein ACRDOL_01000 [Streptosporangiaceae bacterium]
MQPSQFLDRGLVGLALHHDDHVDVAACRAEIPGHQRAVQIDADQAAARKQPVPQPPQQQGDVRRKLRSGHDLGRH